MSTKPPQNDTNIQTVEMVIELAGSAVQPYRTKINEAGVQEFQQELLKNLQDLAVSLGLPISFRLEFADETASQPPRWPVEVRIDGHWCRLQFDMRGITDETELMLSRFIAKAVTEDREKLISEKVLSYLLPSLLSVGEELEDRIDPMQLHAMALCLVQRGLSANRLSLLIPMLDKTSTGGATLFGNFEEALRAPDQISLDIVLGTEQLKAVCSLGNRPEKALDALTILTPELNALRRRLFEELGIILPKINVNCDKDLRPNEIRFRLNDLILPPEEGIEKSKLLVQESLSAPDFLQFIITRLESEIRGRAELFVTTYCIDNLRTSSPQLVEAVCQKIGTPTLLRILEGLLMEGLSIRDLRGICESILTIDSVTTADQNKLIVFFPPLTNICPLQQEKPLETLDDNDYLACVRMWMKSWFSANYAPDGTLIVYLLDQQLEQRIANSDVEPLTEDERTRLLTTIESETRYNSVHKRPPILTTADVRHQLWTLLEREFRRYPVLNYLELAPDLNIQPIARFSL
jgi:hypothetical protein